MKDFFLSRKRNERDWSAKSYGAARSSRKNVVSMRNKRKWMNLQSANEIERAKWIDSDDTRSDAFADDEKYFVWWRSVDDINCKMII